MAGYNKPANSLAGVRLHCHVACCTVVAGAWRRAAWLLCLILHVNAGADAASIVVARRGWHIDVGFAVADLQAPLTDIAAQFPGAQYLFFGFGDRQYLHAAHHGVPVLLRALWPGPGLLLVTALGATPAAAFGGAHVIELSISREGSKDVQSFVWNGLSTSERSSLEAGGIASGMPGPYRGSLFFESDGTYSAVHTCNTWAAETLRRAGLQVHSRGIIFSGQLWSQVRKLRKADATQSMER